MDQQNCQRKKKESHEGVRLGIAYLLLFIYYNLFV